MNTVMISSPKKLHDKYWEINIGYWEEDRESYSYIHGYCDQLLFELGHPKNGLGLIAPNKQAYANKQAYDKGWRDAEGDIQDGVYD
jgi:hypothetical protein